MWQTIVVACIGVAVLVKVGIGVYRSFTKRNEGGSCCTNCSCGTKK